MSLSQAKMVEQALLSVVVTDKLKCIKRKVREAIFLAFHLSAGPR